MFTKKNAIIADVVILIVVIALEVTSYRLDTNASTVSEWLSNQAMHFKHQDFQMYDRIIGGLIGWLFAVVVYITITTFFHKGE